MLVIQQLQLLQVCVNFPHLLKLNFILFSESFVLVILQNVFFFFFIEKAIALRRTKKGIFYYFTLKYFIKA